MKEENKIAELLAEMLRKSDRHDGLLEKFSSILEKQASLFEKHVSVMEKQASVMEKQVALLEDQGVVLKEQRDLLIRQGTGIGRHSLELEKLADGQIESNITLREIKALIVDIARPD